MICVWTPVAVKGEKKPVALATVDGGPVKNNCHTKNICVIHYFVSQENDVSKVMLQEERSSGELDHFRKHLDDGGDTIDVELKQG